MFSNKFKINVFLKLTNHYFKVDIKKKTNKREYVYPRFMFFKLCNELLEKTTYNEIGKYTNNHHATVLYGIRQVDNFNSFDKNFKSNYLNLLDICINRLNKMGNAFDNYLTKEDKLHNAVMTFIKLNYKNAFVVHIPNEGKRTPFERYKFKYLGGVSGMPDIMIFTPNLQNSGLAIEIKVGYNKPTENQLKCLKTLENANWSVFWSNSYDECIEKIKKYFDDV
jgi:hypothetical protein